MPRSAMNAAPCQGETAQRRSVSEKREAADLRRRPRGRAWVNTRPRSEAYARAQALRSIVDAIRSLARIKYVVSLKHFVARRGPAMTLAELLASKKRGRPRTSKGGSCASSTSPAMKCPTSLPASPLSTFRAWRPRADGRVDGQDRR